MDEEEQQRFQMNQIEHQMDEMDAEQQHFQMDESARPQHMCVAYHDQDEMVNKDPKLYGAYPSCFVQKIPAAGKVTYKSESVYNIIS